MTDPVHTLNNVGSTDLAELSDEEFLKFAETIRWRLMKAEKRKRKLIKRFEAGAVAVEEPPSDPTERARWEIRNPPWKVKPVFDPDAALAGMERLVVALARVVDLIEGEEHRRLEYPWAFGKEETDGRV